MFWHGRVVGVDWAFKRRPLHTGIQASALALPFRDQAFPAVVSSDVLEHIQPDLRHNAIMEWQRVCQADLLLTFPSGPAAEQAYHWLARRVHPQPIWLQEHLQNGLPDANRVADWLQAQGWQVETLWSEDAMMHVRLVRWEETAIGKLIDYSLSRIFGRWLAPRLPMPRGVPCACAYTPGSERPIKTDCTGVRAPTSINPPSSPVAAAVKRSAADWGGQASRRSVGSHCATAVCFCQRKKIEHRVDYTGASVPAKMIHASTVLAARLRMM